MSQNEIMQLAWVAVAAVVAPLVALRLRRLAIPGVVLELVFGMLLGPSVLDWVDPIGLIADFSNFGLALLMFLAGFEIDLQRMRGRPLALAATTWCGSLVIGLAAAIVLFLGGHRHGELIIGLTLVTTALGTLLPIVRDGGVLDTPLGPHILAVGTIAEFGPIVLVALLLGGHHPVGTALLLLGFGVVAMGFAVAASRPWGRAFAGWLRAGLHASSQLPVRFSMLVMIALVLLTTELGLDVLLGAFAAGVIVRTAIGGAPDSRDARVFSGKLEAIGFGVFVPVFFVISGARLDLASFEKHPAAIAAIPLVVVLLLVARGVPTFFGYRGVLPTRQRLALALMASTGLPLIVVITTIGVSNGDLSTQAAAAIVTGGIMSVLIFPLVAMQLLTGRLPNPDSIVDEAESL